MIIIVEGADLVGKSTLVERLAVDRNYPVVKIRWALLGDPEIETRAMAAATTAILRAARPNIIFDRIYFSWWAYGPVLGYPVNYMSELIAGFQPVDSAVLILLTASADELQRRFERKPDLYFTLDVILEANKRFPSLLDLLPAALPRLHLDTTPASPDEIFASADAFLQAHHREEKP